MLSILSEAVRLHETRVASVLQIAQLTINRSLTVICIEHKLLLEWVEDDYQVRNFRLKDGLTF